jgi:hypothetical protein
VKKTARLASRERTTPPPPTYDWMEHNWVKDPGPLIEALLPNAPHNWEKDPGSLIEAFCFNAPAPLPIHLRLVLADLLMRHRLVRKQGAKHTPFYRLSDANAKLMAAVVEFNRLRALGLPRDDAIKSAARDYVKPKTLRTELDGKRGVRRYKPRPPKTPTS